jgi:hypothetical protein
MIHKTISAILVSCLLVISLAWKPVQADAPTKSKDEIAQEQFSKDLDDWLYKLAMCESTNNPKAVNLIDSDGKPAYGLYQYKLGTFLGLSKKYNVFPELTVDTVHKYAMDGDKSHHLTREVIKSNPKEADQWGCRFKTSVGKPPALKDYLQE